MKKKLKKKFKSAYAMQWALQNYLNTKGIYTHNNDMQIIIINSFYNQNGGDNNQGWPIKVEYASQNFKQFTSYAGTWKQKQDKN